MSKFQEKLIEQGYCDQRGAGFCATATQLPGGEYGMVALCVNGNTLSLYDVDMKSNLGRRLYEVELKNITDLKIKTFFLSAGLRFSYMGKAYAFTNFTGVKAALKVIEEESRK